MSIAKGEQTLASNIQTANPVKHERMKREAVFLKYRITNCHVVMLSSQNSHEEVRRIVPSPSFSGFKKFTYQQLAVSFVTVRKIDKSV